jgi:hypothetical protein
MRALAEKRKRPRLVVCQKTASAPSGSDSHLHQAMYKPPLACTASPSGCQGEAEVVVVADGRDRTREDGVEWIGIFFAP